MSIVVLKGQKFKTSIGVGILIKPPLKSSPNDKMLPSFKRWAIYLLKPTHKSWNYYVLGSFAIWGNNATTMHLPHGFTPTNTCPTKNSNGRCLGYAMFECHANFQINWESLHIGINKKKTCLGYATLKPRRWQISNTCSWTGPTIN